MHGLVIPKRKKYVVLLLLFFVLLVSITLTAQFQYVNVSPTFLRQSIVPIEIRSVWTRFNAQHFLNRPTVIEYILFITSQQTFTCSK